MEFKEVNGKLVNDYVFKSQTGVVQFLLKGANYADEIKHHPECKIHKAFQLEITLFTHDQNKITTLDFQLAEKIDFYYNQ